jgi:glycosyltransferase involved in cell wall biosynthesis
MVGSGYGVQTALAVSRLHGEDHQFAVSCNYGQEGFVAPWMTEGGEVSLLPKDGRIDDHGQGIVPMHAETFGAEVIITHYDAWVFEPDKLLVPWVPWYPVDCEELPEKISSRVQHAAMRITQTRHAVDRTERVGLDAEYVPAAFDKSLYYPRQDGAQVRSYLKAEDKFLVACVAANTGHPASPSRKSYPQMFEGFRLFLDEMPDAKLYIHAHQHGQFDLGALAHHYGIQDHLVTAVPYHISVGAYGPDYMAGIYSAADVLLSPSMGEGFGVPIVEAQACGTPVITGDWTAMSEVTRTGLAIPKEDAAPVPIVGYGTMYMPRAEAIRDALLESMKWKKWNPAMIAKRVQEYEIETVIRDHWLPVLAKLEDKLQRPVQGSVSRKVQLADPEVAVA